MELISIERSTYEVIGPNSFTNPPQFAYPCIIAAPYQGALNPRLAFILDRNAFARPKRTLCLQRISKIASLLQLFFVTLHTHREK